MKAFYLLSSLLIAFLLSTPAKAQLDSLQKPSTVIKSDSLKQLDIIDIFDYIFSIKRITKPDTAKIPPGKMLVSFIPVVGYTLEAGFEGSLTVNTSFYTSDQAHTNLSILYTLIQYSIQNQLTIPIMSRIWFKNNNYELLGDTRFFSYPSKTYGLGSTSTTAITDKINYLYIKIHEALLRHFSSFYYAGLGYYYDNHWDIADYTNKTDYPLYNGNRTQTISSGPCATFKYDSRNNGNNPDKGFLGSITYRYNSTMLGSDNNWQFMEVELRKYFRLSHKTILAFWSLNRFTWGGYVPYLDLPSNGFGTEHYTGRGYIQGRFRGNDMFYNEGELRFGITRNGFLGGVIFANSQSFTNWPVENVNAIFPGGGAGLRFKFNKFSKVNFCVDYALGVQGSNGFFFNLGEVF